MYKFLLEKGVNYSMDPSGIFYIGALQPVALKCFLTIRPVIQLSLNFTVTHIPTDDTHLKLNKKHFCTPEKTEV